MLQFIYNLNTNKAKLAIGIFMMLLIMLIKCSSLITSAAASAAAVTAGIVADGLNALFNKQKQ